MTILILFFGFLLLVAVFGIVMIFRGDSSGTSSYDPPTRHNQQKDKSNTEFIDSYLHRNDEKHDRHKRNQTPW